MFCQVPIPLMVLYAIISILSEHTSVVSLHVGQVTFKNMCSLYWLLSKLHSIDKLEML